MVERYLVLRFTPEHAGERSLLAEEARRTLGAIPNLIDIAVGVPADDHAQAAWDLSIRVRVATASEIARYLAHPVYRRFVDERLTPRVAVIKAWNFDVG